MENMETEENKNNYNDWEEEYWSIKRQKLWDLKAKFERVKETNPELGKELLVCWEELMLFNIPIARSDNGIDFVLTTDTSAIVGHGKFIEKLKDISMEEMDCHLNEVENKDNIPEVPCTMHVTGLIALDENEVTNFGTANKYSCYVCSKPFGMYEAPNFCPHCGIKQNDETAIEFEIERKINEHIDDVMSPDLKGVDPVFVDDNFPGYELSFKRARAAFIASGCEDRDPGVEKIVVPFIRELAEKIVKIGSEEVMHVNDLFATYAELISQVLYPSIHNDAVIVHKKDLELLHNTLVYIKKYAEEIIHEVPLKDRSTKLEYVIVVARERLETIGKYYKHK